ncbi:hypothetical protein [Amycolatopsis sp. NPDC001319]|uniref:hypothetical protein n=1 Tax=unclassified Amycolatopsis TaxID=2618356 RepID=UPI0036C8814A
MGGAFVAAALGSAAPVAAGRFHRRGLRRAAQVFGLGRRGDLAALETLERLPRVFEQRAGFLQQRHECFEGFDQFGDQSGDLRGRFRDGADDLRDDPGEADAEGEHDLQGPADHVADELGDDVAHQRADRGDDFTGGLHPGRGTFAALLRRLQRRRQVLSPLPVGVRGGSGPGLQVGVDRVGQVRGDAAEFFGDVGPGLRLGFDLIRVAGEPVERVLERADVFHQPGDARRENRAERIHRHGQRVQRRADRAHGDRRPVARLDGGGKVVGLFQE